MGNGFAINYEKDTWVHRMDPRAKLIFILVFATVPLFFTEFTYLVGCVLLVLPVWLAAKIEMKPIKGIISGIIMIALIAVVFATFYNYDYPGQSVLFNIGPLTATDVGLRSGLVLGFRTMIPAFVALILICTTDPAALSKAMMKMNVPMNIAFMMMGILKIFPLVSEEMANIKTAQIIRGVSYKGFRNKYKAFRLSVFPLIVNSLRKSRVTGVAVESKGFAKNAWNEYYQEFKFKNSDKLFVVISIIVLIAAVIIRFGYGLGVDPTVVR